MGEMAELWRCCKSQFFRIENQQRHLVAKTNHEYNICGTWNGIMETFTEKVTIRLGEMEKSREKTCCIARSRCSAVTVGAKSLLLMDIFSLVFKKHR